MSVAERLRMLSDLDERYAVEFDREYRGYGNEVVRELIRSIMVDSKKHAGLYKAAAYTVESRSLSITDVVTSRWRRSSGSTSRRSRRCWRPLNS
jgi:predicted subunit of tRNA(5-methylaminomethyl-2-thiouridylate) methyltransferase